jgi:enoyl-CoA hydratase/carnithine racemase
LRHPLRLGGGGVHHGVQPAGLIAEHGISWLLPRLVGIANAADLLYSARRVSGTEAKELGLVNRVFPAEAFERR